MQQSDALLGLHTPDADAVYMFRPLAARELIFTFKTTVCGQQHTETL
jgi:hypothetical protein